MSTEKQTKPVDGSVTFDPVTGKVEGNFAAVFAPPRDSGPFSVETSAVFDSATGQVTGTFSMVLPPIVPVDPPKLDVWAETGVGQMIVHWDTNLEVTGWRIDRNQPEGARVGPWGIDLPPEARSQRFTLLDYLPYQITLQAKTADGVVYKSVLEVTPLPQDPAISNTPWLPFDMVAELPTNAPDVLCHVMPNYTLSDDDESYALHIGANVPTRSALPSGLTMNDAGRSHRTLDTDRLWVWTGTTWSDKGVCPNPDYRRVGSVVPNPSDYWQSTNLPPGKNEAQQYGGPCRNRPPYQPRWGGTTREYRTAMAERNLRDMAARRINVATIHTAQIGESSTHWPRAMDYVRACERLLVEGIDMHVMLQWDCTTSATKSVKNADGSVNVDASAKAMADQFLRVASSPAHWRKDGKLVLGGFGTDLGPDRQRFWRIVRETMAAAGQSTVHMATFLKAAEPLMDAGFRDIVDFGGEWGARTVSAATSDSSRNRMGAYVWRTKYRKAWVAVIAWCDLRPRQGRGWPNGGLRTLDENWATAKGKHSGSNPERASAAHIITWDDFPEGSEFAPSLQSGFALLDYNAWDQEAFQTGVEPVAKRDGIFLCQRIQWWNDPNHPMRYTGCAPAGQTAPIIKQTLFIKPEGGVADNYVDLRVFTPGGDAILEVFVDDVRIHSQPVAKSTGRTRVSLSSAVMKNGTTMAHLIRNGQEVPGTRVTMKEALTQTGQMQDIQPRVASSYRQAFERVGS